MTQLDRPDCNGRARKLRQHRLRPCQSSRFDFAASRFSAAAANGIGTPRRRIRCLLHVGPQSTATSTNVGSAVVAKALHSASSSAPRRLTEIALTPPWTLIATDLDPKALQPGMTREELAAA